MKKLLIAASLAAAVALGAGSTFAQIILPPGGSQLMPPPLPPLPPPKIEVPRVPKMDELPTRDYAPAPRPSFSDKVTTCLQEGAAAGLGPGDRDAYTRACVNSR